MNGSLLPPAGLTPTGGVPAHYAMPPSAQLPQPVGPAPGLNRFKGMAAHMPGYGKSERTPFLKANDFWTGWIPIALNIVIVPAVFTGVFFCFSFFHRDRYKAYLPYAAQLVATIISVVVLILACLKTRRSNWLYYAAFGIFVASGMGAFYGNQNYESIEYFYTFRGMATYVNVNPGQDPGSSFADAGEVYFKEGSRVDTTRAVAFRNTHLFCVAPIIMEELDDAGNVVEGSAKDPKSMDWWAIGTDCCTNFGEEFSCNDVAKPARSGMRLLNQFEAPYYHFAVHQFTAKHGIPSNNPLFFYWVEDPLGTMTSYYLQAHYDYYAQCFQFFGMNLIAVLAVKLGMSL